MRRATLELLSVLVFVLVLVSFLIRGFGQFVLGPAGILVVAGPVSLAAALLLMFVLGYWLLAQIGVTTIEEE